MTYSTDFRQLVLKKHTQGSSIRTLAKKFEIRPQTIQAWKKNPEIKKRKRKPAKIGDASLIRDVELFPDDYHHERAVRFKYSRRSITVLQGKRVKIAQLVH